MAKTAKIDDVKRPERVLPSATSRPILVTELPSTPVGDPMLTPAEDNTGQKTDAAGDSPALKHTARTVVPPGAPEVELAKEGPVLQAAKTPEQAAVKPVSAPQTEVGKTAGADGAATVSKTAVESPPASGTATTTPDTAEDSPKEGDGDSSRDPEAARAAEETAAAEARGKRDAELEVTIASGKYAVPINAVQRKRSRMAALLLCLLALVLAAVLLDAVLDTGLVSAPAGLPHTHLFSKP